MEAKRISKAIRDAEDKAKLINSREGLFGFAQTEYTVLTKIAKDFEPFAQLWATAYDWFKWQSSWMQDAFMTLNPDEMEKDLANAWKTMFKAMRHFQDLPACLAIAAKIKQQMDDFKPHMPLIAALRNPGMRARHWKSLSEELGIALLPDEKFTLRDLFDLHLEDKMDSIVKVTDIAGKEYSIEQALDKMEQEWQAVAFDLADYRDTGTYIIRGADDISMLLDDQLVMAQSMSFSVFKKPFEDRIARWETKLSLMAETIEEWLTCQRQWLYMEPIFSSPDINRQLPAEGKRYSTMDRTWRRIMTQTRSNPIVIQVCADDRLLESLRECNRLLDTVQKGLAQYLETKRAAFPRLYFLSNDELLQILSQAKDPTAVQPHLRKCFENISRLEFMPDLLITAMFSSEDERVEFCKQFYPRGNVENWLLEVESVMKKSVKDVLRSALATYETSPRTEWVQAWPGQVVLAGSQVYWTRAVTAALQTGNIAEVKRLYAALLKQLDDLTMLVRGDVSPLTRLTLGSLIVIDVHARDVVQRLVDTGMCRL